MTKAQAIISFLLAFLVACGERRVRPDTHQRAGVEPQAALCDAVRDDDLDGVRSALTFGASAREPLCVVPGGTRRTPLSEAIMQDEFGIARFLLAHGADPNMLNPGSDVPPIVVAVYSHSPRLVELLLDAGAAPDQRFGPGIGMTPLGIASRAVGSPAIARLVRKGADPNGWVQELGPDGRPGERKTPLMLAAGAGNYLAIPDLLEVGADPGIRNERGHTAADFVLNVADGIRQDLAHPEKYRPSLRR